MAGKPGQRSYVTELPEWTEPRHDLSRPCLGRTDLFFIEEEEPRPGKIKREMVTQMAKDLCAVCPFQAACLEFAITYPWISGVWGGHTHFERRCLAGVCKHPEHDRVAV